MDSEVTRSRMSDHIMIAVRESRNPQSMLRHLRNADFIDGLIRDLEHIRDSRRAQQTARLPPIILREMRVEGPIEDCAVCLEEFKIGEIMIPLPCNDTHPHVFHKKCIDPWLKIHNTCPTCRGKI